MKLTYDQVRIIIDNLDAEGMPYRDHPMSFARAIEAELAKQAPRWISVAERLPEIFQEVMVHPPVNDRQMTAELRRDGLWHYTEYDPYGVVCCETSAVTHWMPLPPAPEQGVHS